MTLFRAAERRRARVLIDARWYFKGPVSGRIVTTELVPRLGELSQQVDLVLITRGGRAERRRLVSVLPSASVVRVPDLTMLGTSLFIMPWLLAVLRPDVAMLQNFCSPLGSRERWVFVFDAIFLRRPELFSRKERVYLSFVKPLASRASRVYTISRTERQHFIDARLAPAAALRVLYLAPRREFAFAGEEDVQRARQVLGLPRRYLLALGRVNVRKRASDIIRAAGLSSSISSACPLVLAGPVDGAQDGHLAGACRVLGDRLRRTGYVDDVLVPGLVKGATALITLSDDEGFGLPPLEAMAAGTPVIATDTVVAREILGNAAAFVDDPSDPRQVAAVIDAVLGDPRRQRALSERGRLVAARFSWDRTAAQLTEEIAERATTLSEGRRRSFLVDRRTR